MKKVEGGLFNMILSLENLQKSHPQLVVEGKQSDRNVRLQQAEEIADYLEFAVDDLNEEEYFGLLQQLVIIAAGEQDNEIQEVELNAVATALSQRDVSQPLDLTALVAQLDNLMEGCLLSAIDILGFAGSERYLCVIKALLKYPSSEVRETATLALEEIEAALQ